MEQRNETQSSQTDAQESAGRKSGAPERAPVSSRLLSAVPELVLLASVIYLFVLASNLPSPMSGQQLSPGFWPRVLSATIGVFTVIRLGQKLLTRKRPAARVESDEGESDAVQWPRVALVVALVVGYVFGTIFLGFFLSTALFLIAFLYLGGQREWYVVPLGILASLAFVYIFLKVVYVALPSGVGVFDQLSVILYRILGIY